MKNGSRDCSTAVTRRSLLEWLGGSTVIALASPWIEACGADASTAGRAGAPGAGGSAGGPAPATGGAAGSAGGQAGAAGAAGDGGTCTMQPGSVVRADLQSWPERTVDPQNLASILSAWKLRIGGLVESPIELGFCDLREMGLITQVTDFHCVEGWSVHDVPWNGIPLSKLLDAVKPKASATFLEMHSVGGNYLESLHLAVAREARSILALGIDGSSLPLKHGFPARIVVPRLLGYKNAKYVERIDLVDYQPKGFWEEYGYANHGEVPSSRLRPGKY